MAGYAILETVHVSIESIHDGLNFELFEELNTAAYHRIKQTPMVKFHRFNDDLHEH